jgi:hypothetical protein
MNAQLGTYLALAPALAVQVGCLLNVHRATVTGLSRICFPESGACPEQLQNSRMLGLERAAVQGFRDRMIFAGVLECQARERLEGRVMAEKSAQSLGLLRWCGIALVPAGVLIVIATLLHPSRETATTIIASEVGLVAAHALYTLAWLLVLLGLPGLYASQ